MYLCRQCNGIFQVVLSDTSSRTIPTVISFSGKERTFGDIAFNKNRTNFKTTIIYPNRWLGLKQEYSIFQNYIDKKRKEIQNNKCKKVIFEFFKKKNLKGLILLLNCIKPEKQYYLKINNANVFKEAIISKYGPNSFTIDLNEEENEEIEDIKEQLNQLTKNVKCLSKKK